MRVAAPVSADYRSDFLAVHRCRTVGPAKRPNLIFSSHEEQKGDIVMHGHMDTVPVGPLDRWTHDPFSSEIVDGRLYGRGACDMKGPVAALAETLILYAEERHSKPLVVLTTSDEESGCSGAEEGTVDRSGSTARTNNSSPDRRVTTVAAISCHNSVHCCGEAKDGGIRSINNPSHSATISQSCRCCLICRLVRESEFLG